MFNIFINDTTFIYTIPHKDIKRCDPSRTIRNIKQIESNSVHILVDGYSDDERDIWEIPEVKKFYLKLINEYPLIITKTDEVTTKNIRLCCSEILEATKKNGITNTTSLKTIEWFKAVFEGEKHLAQQKR